MSWVQENKFAAALAGVSVVGAGVLLTLAMGKGSDFDAANKKLKKALKEEQTLRSAVVYPSDKNLDELTANVNELAKRSEELQGQFEAYRPTPDEVADFAPESFGGLVKGYKDRLDAQFEESNTELPEKCIYGFENYVSKAPKPVATGELKYQMQALEWLLGQLAASQPEALLNLVRSSLDIEQQATSEDEEADKDKAYVVMPVELAFRADEAGYTSFLEAIANSEKYAFTVRYMRIQNENLLPPTVKDASFDAPVVSLEVAPAASGFLTEGFGVEETGEAEAEEPVGETLPEIASDDDDTRILSPILGDESVNVFLKLDLILLKEGSKVSLDEVKEAAGVSSKSSTNKEKSNK